MHGNLSYTASSNHKNKELTTSSFVALQWSLHDRRSCRTGVIRGRRPSRKYYNGMAEEGLIGKGTAKGQTT